tara:strand:- start:1029 stop:3926 length:2898 start_codon:yes stop_codon:yes gene_type:complete
MSDTPEEAAPLSVDTPTPPVDPVVVVEHLFAKSAESADELVFPGKHDLEFNPVVSLLEAMHTRWDGDALVSGLVVRLGGALLPAAPRAKAEAFEDVIRMGGVVESSVLVLDLDRTPHTPWESMDVAKDVVDSVVTTLGAAGIPAGVNSTPRGIHVTVRVSPPVPYHKMASVSNGITQEVSAALDAAGVTQVTVDGSTADNNRRFYLPFIVKRIDGVETQTTSYMNLDALDPLVPPLDITARLVNATTSVPSKTPRTPAGGEPEQPFGPSTTQGITPSELASLDIKRLLNSSKQMKATKGGEHVFVADLKLGDAIASGEAFTLPGKRNVNLMTPVYVVAESIIKKDPDHAEVRGEGACRGLYELIYRMLAPCAIAAAGRDDGDEDEALRDLWRAVWRGVDKVVGAERAAQEDAERERLKRLERMARGEENRAAMAERHLADLPPLEGGALETPAEQEARAGGTELPLIVSLPRDGVYRVLDARNPGRLRYFDAVKDVNMLKQNIVVGIGGERDNDIGQADGPLGIPLHDAEGQHLPLTKVLQTHAVRVAVESIEHGTNRTRILVDKETGSMELRVPGVQFIPAVALRDPEIEGYLQALCGREEDHRDLLIWLALFTQIDRPLLGLYLQGPPSSGKSLLMGLLSTLYEGGRSITMEDAVSSFPMGLLKTFFVTMDEGTSERQLGKKYLGLVPEGRREVKQKYLGTALVVSYLRFFIAANDGNALPIREKEAQGADNQDAMAMRVLHILADKAAVSYLENVNKREGVVMMTAAEASAAPTQGVAAWFGVRFRGHMQWIRETVQFDGSHRFGVRSERSAYHDAAMVTPEQERLYVFCLRVLKSGANAGMNRKHAFIYKDGSFWGNTIKLRDEWVQAAESGEKVPTAGAITKMGRIAAGGSSKKVRDGKDTSTRWEVTPKELARWCALPGNEDYSVESITSKMEGTSTEGPPPPAAGTPAVAALLAGTVH